MEPDKLDTSPEISKFVKILRATKPSGSDRLLLTSRSQRVYVFSPDCCMWQPVE